MESIVEQIRNNSLIQEVAEKRLVIIDMACIKITEMNKSMTCLRAIPLTDFYVDMLSGNRCFSFNIANLDNEANIYQVAFPYSILEKNLDDMKNPINWELEEIEHPNRLEGDNIKYIKLNFIGKRLNQYELPLRMFNK